MRPDHRSRSFLLIRYKESLAVGDLCVDRRIRVRLCADIDAVRVGDRHQLCNLKRFVLRLLSCQDILRFYITGNVSGTDLVPARRGGVQDITGTVYHGIYVFG